jgi:hypothetical protein
MHSTERINSELLSLQRAIYMDWFKAHVTIFLIPGILFPFLIFIRAFSATPSLSAAGAMFLMTLFASILFLLGPIVASLLNALLYLLLFRYIPRLAVLILSLQAILMGIVTSRKYGEEIEQYGISENIAAVGLSIGALLFLAIIIKLAIRFMNKRLHQQ